MIHVNARGLLIREVENERQLIIQLRKREGEPEVYELPGGRINEYEKIVDGLKREILEETGLKVKSIRGEESAILTTGDSFSMECLKPFSVYQTLEGPVDSFGVHFICEVEGELLTTGDDTADIHWATKKEVQKLIETHKFSEIDLPAVLMFLRDDKLNSKLSQMEKSMTTKIGRICEIQKNAFYISFNGDEIKAKLKGNYGRQGNEEWPVVGDYVEYTHNPIGDSVINRVCERKSIQSLIYVITLEDMLAKLKSYLTRLECMQLVHYIILVLMNWMNISRKERPSCLLVHPAPAN